jgi:5-methylcytosine-specific restriction enzyme subunit McrC
MARVYEDFVTTALREALAHYPGSTHNQYRTRLDVDDDSKLARVSMFVDVVHLVGGVPGLVFDAKYKTGNAKGQYANSDYYQMLAYCTALEVPRAWLVSARGGSGRVRRIVNTGISVIEYSLDLISDPRALLAQIDTLARGAWRTIERT